MNFDNSLRQHSIASTFLQNYKKITLSNYDSGYDPRTHTVRIYQDGGKWFGEVVRKVEDEKKKPLEKAEETILL